MNQNNAGKGAGLTSLEGQHAVILLIQMMWISVHLTPQEGYANDNSHYKRSEKMQTRVKASCILEVNNK